MGSGVHGEDSPAQPLPQVIPRGKEPWDSPSGCWAGNIQGTGHTIAVGRLALWVDSLPSLEQVRQKRPGHANRPGVARLCHRALDKPPPHFTPCSHLEISKLPSVSNTPGSAIGGTSTRLTLRYYKFVIPQFRGLRSYFPCYKQSLSN